MSLKIALAGAALALSTGAASATTLFYDDFESYMQGAPASISPTWTVSEGSVDVIGTPGDYPWYPGQQIDMNGSGGESTAARIYTLVSGFIIGKLYTLSFDYGSNKNSNGEETLEFNFSDLLFSPLVVGNVSTSGPVPNMLSWAGSWIATTDQIYLVFQDGQAGLPYDDDDNQGGPVLDNVMISAVPLPAGAPLLLAGLAGLGLLRRRRT